MPATKQPKWRFVTNIGDRSPLDYGGYFIFEDRTGVYPEEAELLVVENEEEQDEKKLRYTIYRILLERTKLVDGYLVPEAYESNWSHPLENYDEWFHKELSHVADSVGRTKEELEAALTSRDPIQRAIAYQNIYDYHGWENGDSDPLRGLSRSEVKKRYRGILDKFGRAVK